MHIKVFKTLLTLIRCMYSYTHTFLHVYTHLYKHIQTHTRARAHITLLFCCSQYLLYLSQSTHLSISSCQTAPPLELPFPVSLSYISIRSDTRYTREHSSFFCNVIDVIIPIRGGNPMVLGYG